MTEKTPAGLLQSLAQGVEVVRLLAMFGPMRNMELADRTGLSRPTISRIVKTLMHLGLVEQAGTQGLVHLGVGAAVIGTAYELQSHLLKGAWPLMKEFSDKHQATVLIGAYDRLSGRGIYLDGVETDSMIDHPGDKGSLFPLMSSVAGRAVLGGLSLSERKEFLRKIESDHPTEEWPEILRRFEADMDELSEKGYCQASPDVFASVSVCALPLEIERVPYISLACAVPMISVGDESIGKLLGDPLKQLARKIENKTQQLSR